jgi:hypothetical protein
MKDNQERVQQQLQKANGETLKKQEEMEEEHKRLKAINEEEFDAAQWIQRMSRGVRGGK